MLLFVHQILSARVAVRPCLFPVKNRICLLWVRQKRTRSFQWLTFSVGKDFYTHACLWSRAFLAPVCAGQLSRFSSVQGKIPFLPFIRSVTLEPLCQITPLVACRHNFSSTLYSTHQVLGTTTPAWLPSSSFWASAPSLSPIRSPAPQTMSKPAARTMSQPMSRPMTSSTTVTLLTFQWAMALSAATVRQRELALSAVQPSLTRA